MHFLWLSMDIYGYQNGQRDVILRVLWLLVHIERKHFDPHCIYSITKRMKFSNLFLNPNGTKKRKHPVPHPGTICKL